MKKIILSILALLLTSTVYAATTPNSFVATQTPTLGLVQFLQGTDTAGTYKTLYTGNANGTKISGIYATSNDGSASHLVTCEVVLSSIKYGGTAITIPISSGYANATPAINMLSSANWPGLPVDSDGNPYIYLPTASYTLQCTYATALTSATKVNLVAVVGDF